jgi:uncharacterized tellurite resistance protein B-like protein
MHPKEPMYTSVINSQDQALCHLFFHCILKDGEMADRELDAVSDKLVQAGLNKALNFKDEIISYREYRDSVADEQEYLQYLIEQINPVNELALYTYCAELLLSDNVLTEEEESLLNSIGETLGLDDHEQATAKKIMVQRKVVETEKIF